MFSMLRRERAFAVLLTGNLLSQIGDGVHEFIFIVTVLKVTRNDVALSGVVYFFRFIPYLILGPLGGALSDRLSRRNLMAFADLARMTITCVFCALLVGNQIGLITLALIGMLMTSFRTLFQPAFQGTVPSQVRAENLPAANGATQMAAEVGGLVGPALGGVMLSAVGNPGYVLLLDAATYLLSTLCIWKAVLAEVGRATGEAITIRRLYGDFTQNLRQSLASRDLFVTIIFSALCILLAGAAVRIMIPSMLQGAGHADSMIGYAMSFVAFGAIAGALLCTKVTRDFTTGNLMLYWCLYGAMLALLPLCLVSAPIVLAGCVAVGVIGAFVDVILPTNIQRLSTDANLGKNFSLFSTLANTGEALSGGFAGMLTLLTTVGMSMSILGVVIALIAYAGKIRSVANHG